MHAYMHDPPWRVTQPLEGMFVHGDDLYDHLVIQMVQALQLNFYSIVPDWGEWHDSPPLEGIVPDMEEERKEPHPHLQLVDQ